MRARQYGCVLTKGELNVEMTKSEKLSILDESPRMQKLEKRSHRGKKQGQEPRTGARGPTYRADFQLVLSSTNRSVRVPEP